MFPTSWKSSNVILILKEGPRDNPNNYRPISLLPFQGKILEKLIHCRIFDYLQSHGILTVRQGGFRPGQSGHSTAMMAGMFVMDILYAQTQDKMTAAIFVDLRKAFDTIDHTILMKKLKLYGIRNSAYEWFANYIMVDDNVPW